MVACIENSTAYVDSTGEHVWTQQLAAQWHEKAMANKAIVYPSSNHIRRDAEATTDHPPMRRGVQPPGPDDAASRAEAAPSSWTRLLLYSTYLDRLQRGHHRKHPRRSGDVLAPADDGRQQAPRDLYARRGTASAPSPSGPSRPTGSLPGQPHLQPVSHG